MDTFYKLKQRNGTAATLFRVKNNVVGNKTSTQEPTSIIDPTSGELLFEPKKIKDACLAYCKQLLTNSVPKEDIKDDVVDSTISPKSKVNQASGTSISTICVRKRT